MRDFNAPGHFYTSYPSLNHWTEDYGHAEYSQALAEFNGPLHLYLHIPFCKKLCSYCICNVIISNDREKIQNFLDHLCREVDILKPYKPDIRDVHLGGGTPSHLDRKQFTQLCEKLWSIAPFRYMNEVAMEIDPRTVTQDDLRHYASHYVNRISFGVQDFNPKVQEAINRVQPPEMISDLLKVRHLFKGVNFDLLYGLPHQTWETLNDTLDKTIEMSPERITLLKYCHAPEVRRHMRLINVTDLPKTQDLRPLYERSVEKLLKAGYIWIGFDHFAKVGDSLHSAICKTPNKPKGSLGRTFNGFTSGTTEMVGLGPTTTSVFGKTYAQAHYELKDYYEAVNKGEFPIGRGYTMGEDDLIRRQVIFDLLCKQMVKIDNSYFEREIEELAKYPDLCHLEDFRGETCIILTTEGRMLTRNICKVFDVKDVKPEHMKIAQKNMIRRHANPAHQSA